MGLQKAIKKEIGPIIGISVIFLMIIFLIIKAFMFFEWESSRPGYDDWMKKQLAEVPFKEYKIKNMRSLTEQQQHYTLYQLLDEKGIEHVVKLNDDTVNHNFSDKDYSYMVIKYLDHEIKDEKWNNTMVAGYYLGTEYKK